MKKYLLWLLTLVWTWIIWYLTQYPNLVITPSSLWDTVIADASHFGFFGVLAILLYFALPRFKFLNSNLIPIAITSLYGIIIEFHQGIVPGRTPDVMDWLLDTLGAIIFLVTIRALLDKHTRNLV